MPEIIIPAGERTNASSSITLFGTTPLAVIGGYVYHFTFSGDRLPGGITVSGTKDVGGAVFLESYSEPEDKFSEFDFEPDENLHVSITLDDFKTGTTAAQIAALEITIYRRGTAMKFTRIPTTTFEEIAINAGVICTDFTPATGTIAEANILGATSGGLTVTAVPEFADMGEDIDNCPKNTKELKKIKSWTVTASGTLVTMKSATAKRLLAAANVASNKITPRMDLDPTASTGDFGDLWIVGDYSDKNGAANGGFVALHVLNALSTGGFSFVSADGEKAKFAFEFTGHVSIDAQDVVPFEMYIQPGTAET